MKAKNWFFEQSGSGSDLFRLEYFDHANYVLIADATSLKMATYKKAILQFVLK